MGSRSKGMAVGGAFATNAKQSPFQQIATLPASPKARAPLPDDSLDAFGGKAELEAQADAKDAEVEALQLQLQIAELEFEKEKEEGKLKLANGSLDQPALPTSDGAVDEGHRKRRNGSFGSAKDGSFTHRDNPFDIMND